MNKSFSERKNDFLKADKDNFLDWTQMSPTFQKFMLFHFAFKKAKTLGPVFANQEKSKDFTFMKKAVTVVI